MKKVQINYSQLLFLYAYLRLINLSLDRNRWTTWDELQNYFKNIISPSKVAQYLINSFNLPIIDLENFNFIPREKSVFTRLKSGIFKTFSLQQDEVLYCCRLLYDFDKVLNSDTKKYHSGIEKIRVNIAIYNMNILSKMILSKDLNRLMKIEHFWQNETNDISELDEFIPKDLV